MAPRKPKKTALEKALEKIFYVPQASGSFGGVQALKGKLPSRLKPTSQRVLKWLSRQEAYTLHKPVRKKFKRSRVVVSSMDDQWQADLIVIPALASQNDGYKYLLTCMDVLSKYAWVVPLKDKAGATLVAAFTRILSGGRKPKRLQCDKGTEFTNRVFQAYLSEQGIDFFTTHNEETKASLVERFNQTIKNKIWRYFTHQNTQRYVEVLPALVESYNNTHHRSIGMRPSAVDRLSQEQVWHTMYGHRTPQAKLPRYKVGDHVRISKAKRVFGKGYLPNWSKELFTVKSVMRTEPRRYRLVDAAGELLEGSFYEPELVLAEKTDDVYEIEEVLKKRKGGRELYVKWLGYPASFNSWIEASQLV